MIHKKILIAGFLEQTRNYCAAFSLLGADTSVLCGTGRELSLLLADGRLPDPADFDGLVLPGGGDISPFFYHMENAGSRNIDSLLDSVQFSLFQAFMTAGKPVLGICKGLQLINVAFGGTLIQELGPESLAIHAWEDAAKIHITIAAHGSSPGGRSLRGGSSGSPVRAGFRGRSPVSREASSSRGAMASGADVLFSCTGGCGRRK